MASKLSIFVLLISALSLCEAQAGHYHHPTSTGRYSTKFTVIQNPKKNLVLDGSEDVVQARPSTDSLAQSWYINHTDSGTFYFINMKTNKVLSIQKGRFRFDHKVVTTDPNFSSEYQQWYVNSDGSLVNAGDKEMALEVDILGKLVLASRDKFGSDRQVFRIHTYEKY